LPDKKKSSIARTFGDLKVRPKLMVLHNLFFLVLTCAAYFSLIPLFEKLVSTPTSARSASWNKLVIVTRRKLEREPKPAKPPHEQ
jgi:hypothetical protein